ncbi:MAG: SpoIVB peptidase, partial [Clostridia bacterium]|nr:SpoIVB peptidase [Clostridia bacterium]
ITGCVKGEKGKAGELRGVFAKDKEIANIDRNLDCGVYGKIVDGYNFDKLETIEVGRAKVGSAFIKSTINGEGSKLYKISIIKTDNYSTTKNFVVRVDDENLLSLTGGIVQGMSGSPIIQDGKLVGAVTHVFINDPTRGFGISIYNMLDN